MKGSPQGNREGIPFVCNSLKWTSGVFCENWRSSENYKQILINSGARSQPGKFLVVLLKMGDFLGSHKGNANTFRRARRAGNFLGVLSKFGIFWEITKGMLINSGARSSPGNFGGVFSRYLDRKQLQFRKREKSKNLTKHWPCQQK